MALFLVIPLFIMALIMGVQSWLWRVVFAALVLAAGDFSGRLGLRSPWH